MQISKWIKVDSSWLAQVFIYTFRELSIILSLRARDKSTGRASPKHHRPLIFYLTVCSHSIRCFGFSNADHPGGNPEQPGCDDCILLLLPKTCTTMKDVAAHR